MNSNQSRQTIPALLLGALLFALIASAFVPAKWFGVEPRKMNVSEQPIDFTKLRDDTPLIKDTNNDGEISWAEVVRSTEQGSSSIIELQGEKPDPVVIARLNDPDNLTASFSKNLYLASAQITNNGGVDEETQKQVFNKLMTDETGKIVFKKYAVGDITIAKDESKESIKEYGNKMAIILNGMITEKKIGDDFNGLNQFVRSKNDKDLLAITSDAAALQGVVKKLTAIPVPPSAIVHHLIILNQISIYSEVLFNLSKASSDPIRATYVLNSYPQTIVSTLLVYKKLSEYFTFKNITFSGKESGYVFTIGYTLQ
jgi:hypothetical protein